MPSGYPDIIDYNKIYNSNNYGPFKIIDETRIDGYDRRAVVIQFINTGTIETVPYSQAMAGRVKDVYMPKIAGIACIGHATCYHPAYVIWRNMIFRCYNINSQDYINYGAKGVKVCQKWLCFEFFIEDLPFIDGYENWVNNPNMYHLDKDYKQEGVPTNMKIYSLETCCFLNRSDNIALSDHNDKFIGLEPIPSGNVRVRPRINNVRYPIGLFEDKLAAANAYNNFMNYHFGNDKKILNKVPYMNPSEVIKYNLKPKTMCIIKES